MIRHKKIKKPPTGQGRGGKSENQRGGDVFSIQDNTTNPLILQTDFNRQADIFSLKSEYWKLMSDACDILAILQAAEVDHE